MSYSLYPDPGPGPKTASSLFSISMRKENGGRNSTMPAGPFSGLPPSPSSPVVTQVDTVGNGLQTHIPRPSGIAGDYYDDDEPYGPDYWNGIIESALRLRHQPVEKFLMSLASFLNEDISELLESEARNSAINSLSQLATQLSNARGKDQDSYVQLIDPQGAGATPRGGPKGRTQLAKEIKGKSIAASVSGIRAGGIKGTGGASSSSGSGSGGKPGSPPPGVDTSHFAGLEKDFADLDRRVNKLSEKRGRGDLPPPDRSRSAVLYWLLTEVDQKSAVDRDLIDMLYPTVSQPQIEWITHEWIGAFRFIKDSVTGAIERFRKKYNLTYDNIIIDYRDDFAELIALSFKVERMTRFSTQAQKHEEERRYKIALERVEALVGGGDPIDESEARERYWLKQMQLI